MDTRLAGDGPGLFSRIRFGRLGLDVVLLAAATVDGAVNQSPGWNRPFLLTALMVLAVTVRRRFPLAAFVVGAPALGWAQSTLGPVLLAHTLATRERRPRVLIGVLAAVAVVDCGPVLSFSWSLWDADLSAVLKVVTTLGGAAALGAFRVARHDLAVRLVQLQAARDREMTLADGAARSEERTRLAREMHDVVSHEVSLIAISAGALRVNISSPHVREAAEEIRRLAVRTTDELRRMLTALRSDGHQPLSGPRSLADVVTLWADWGLRGSLELDDGLLDRVPNSLQRTLFHIAHEGLSNAARHSPGASVDLVIAGRGRELTMSVENGPALGPEGRAGPRGEVPLGTGHGLLGVEERVAAAGGKVSYGRTRDGGFRVVAVFRLDSNRDLALT